VTPKSLETQTEALVQFVINADMPAAEKESGKSYIFIQGRENRRAK
jgi:hypothetical protein